MNDCINIRNTNNHFKPQNIW